MLEDSQFHARRVSGISTIPMNRYERLLQSGRVAALVAGSLLALLLAGCDERPLKVGVANWKPQSTGGPIETRPLPPAQQLHSNYQQWLDSDITAKVRLYEAVLQYSTNQVNYTVKIGKGDTPLGASYFTDVSFSYRDSTNGQYQLEWSMRGRQQPDFLQLSDHPKKVWLRLFGAPGESSFPRLKIVAIEGVESREVLVAEPGRNME
jgi:hypothetical protein